MQYLYIFLSAIGSLILLFISTKIIGNKQMSELNMFDYINGITIGSIAAEMATSLENIQFSVIAIAVYTSAIALTAFATERNIKLRRFLTGRSLILMDNGKIYSKNFKTAKIDMNEFLTQCRINGFFNIDDIETAIIEQNGKLSFLPKTTARPVNTKDLNLLIKQETPSITIILDGRLLEENLKDSGHDRAWLDGELERLKVTDMRDVFLGICNDKTLTVYNRLSTEPKNDLFQ